MDSVTTVSLLKSVSLPIVCNMIVSQWEVKLEKANTKKFRALTVRAPGPLTTKGA
jgi:hypothetical protein